MVVSDGGQIELRGHPRSDNVKLDRRGYSNHIHAVRCRPVRAHPSFLCPLMSAGEGAWEGHAARHKGVVEKLARGALLLRPLRPDSLRRDAAESRVGVSHPYVHVAMSREFHVSGLRALPESRFIGEGCVTARGVEHPEVDLEEGGSNANYQAPRMRLQHGKVRTNEVGGWASGEGVAEPGVNP